MIKTSTFLDLNQLNEKHTLCQRKTTIRPNTITAQEAGIFFNAEFEQFWNGILFSKHSDTLSLLLGKAYSYSFFSSNTQKL